MKSVSQLPQGYGEILQIDLQKNKKQAMIVNVLSIAIGAIMVVIAAFFVPLSSIFDGEPMDALVKYVAMIMGLIAYLILHEAVHGIAMRHYCRDAKVRFGFTGMYAYAASEGYYCRRDYTVIGLAPVVVWGLVLAVLNAVVSQPWFYVVYLIQVGNLSGAAGDLYVTWKMSTLPDDILVRDSGVAMRVFSAKK